MPPVSNEFIMFMLLAWIVFSGMREIFRRRRRNEAIWYPVYDEMLAELKYKHGIEVYEIQKGIFTYTGSTTLYPTLVRALWAVYTDKFGYQALGERERQISSYSGFLHNYR